MPFIMQKLLSILFWLLPILCIGQVKDSMFYNKANNVKNAVIAKSVATGSYKSEIFTSGFIDVVNNGQLNASARLVRLYIGEPGKFAVPLSLYSGVSSNSFQNTQGPSSSRSNDGLVTNFINPLSGLANVSIEGTIFSKKSQKKISKIGVIYHLGDRVLTGTKTGLATNPTTGKPINFLNSFASVGLYFQTGAWERNNTKDTGISWLAVRYIGCYTKAKQLKEIMPLIQTNGMYHGYSFAWGVEISDYVRIKVVYYKYVKKPEIDYDLPIYQFSFNYSLKK